MHNVAYKIDVSADSSESDVHSTKPGGGSDVCTACGESLFGSDAEACSWQAWGNFWEIMGLSDVELICGACGEYLRDFFKTPD